MKKMKGMAMILTYHLYIISDPVDRPVGFLHWLHHTRLPSTFLGQGKDMSNVMLYHHQRLHHVHVFIIIFMQACREKWGEVGARTQYTWHFSHPFYVWSIVTFVFLAFLYTTVTLILDLVGISVP